MHKTTETAIASERGAIMLCGLFFCVLCLSFVYYLWGIAEVVRYRQQVQDAADAGAFAAAVVHASGMNLLALLNMVMAALLAILVALRLTQLLIWVAIGIIVAVGWMSGGALYSAITPLQQLSGRIDDIADEAEDPIHNLIEVVHNAGDVVARVTPLAGVARSLQLARDGYGPDVHGALAIPGRFDLPVEDDSFAVLCERATDYATKMALFPLDPVLPGDKVQDGVSTALSKLTAAGSGWFCGEQGSEPPSAQRGSKRKVQLPVSVLRERCQASFDASDSEVDVQACEEASLFELASWPDARGECRVGQPLCPARCHGVGCPPTGDDCNDGLATEALRRRARAPVPSCEPLRWRFEAARTQCDPRSDRLQGVWWVQQQVRRRFRLVAGTWQRVSERPRGKPRLVMDDASKRHPCGRRGSVGTGYSPDGVVCESPGSCVGGLSEGPCLRRGAQDGATFEEDVVQVLELVRCVREEKVPKAERRRQAEAVDVRPEGGDDSDSDLVPFRLEKDLWLGDDDFQLKALAFGRGVSEMPRSGVRLASWGRPVQRRQVLAIGTALERFGLAQAEYYFAGSGEGTRMEDVPNMLWKMGWRARLRPLRLSESGLCQGAQSEQMDGFEQLNLQADQLDACAQLDAALSHLPEVP